MTFLGAPRVRLAGWTGGSSAWGGGSLSWAQHFQGGTVTVALNTLGRLIFAGHVVGEWKE